MKRVRVGKCPAVLLVVAAARDALTRIDLEWFVTSAQDTFAKELDSATRRIQHRLPKPADRWGTARKALNIFLRDVLYNTYLSRELHFRQAEPWLELPLDSFTARALRREVAGADLPRWPGVARLDRRTSAHYQHAADDVARERKIERVHLDIFWWRETAN